MNEKQIEEILDKASTDEPLTDYERGVFDGYFDGIQNGWGADYDQGFADGQAKLRKEMKNENTVLCNR